jgi:hypothetical protein
MVQGLIKRIGDGWSTHIWEDNWLLRDNMMKLIVSAIPNPPTLVSEFFDETSVSWREDLVRACFLPWDGMLIQFLVFHCQREDNLISMLGTMIARAFSRFALHTG